MSYPPKPLVICCLCGDNTSQLNGDFAKPSLKTNQDSMESKARFFFRDSLWFAHLLPVLAARSVLPEQQKLPRTNDFLECQPKS